MTAGDRGVDLERVVNLLDFEPLARKRMAGPPFDYVAGGAWDEQTLAENVDAWREFRFIPRVLRDVRTLDLSGSFLGRPSSLPIAIAPMAAQAMAHPNAEAETLIGAAAAGIPFCLSTSSSMTMEEVARAAPDAERWFQLYVVHSLEFSRALVERAAASGYRAIVLTVDLPVLGFRERDRRSGFALPGMPHMDGGGPGEPNRYGALELQRGAGLTWDSIAEIGSWSALPLVLKGILSAADARRAAEAGVAGIVVSNHGGRQLDRSVTSADVLEEIVEAVDGRCEVWADGGIRRGLDVVAALALGATGVLVGRPFYWALAAAGRSGVERAAAILRGELELALPLLGCSSFADVDGSLLA
ncbi:MAG TPA: alpha-hydroxy acid oxidase [Candidatus Dormibacteraeota bacterium]|nr:alpha-hydroxy acid oxidase [Candidatus Dormibacteraeota bacterium]